MRVLLAIIVHGGAWYIPPDEWEAHKAGCRAAAVAGFAVLRRGGDALDAVETAIVTMEDDPTLAYPQSGAFPTAPFFLVLSRRPIAQ